MGIPERLVEVRERSGYTRKRLAEEAEMPYTTITKYENGEREAGSDYLVYIAKKFNVTTDYLLGIENEQTKNSPTPAAAEARENNQVTREDLLEVLQKLHIVESGSAAISDADLQFLMHIISVIDDWFSNRG